MTRRGWTALFAVLALAAAGARADAVDRSLGAGIARPAATGAPWSGRARKRLARDLDALLAAAPTLRGAHVGLLAVATQSGEVLYAHNADDTFVPASTLKLLTGSAALALLGRDFRFRTAADVVAPGATLVVRAGGDPLLQTADVIALGRAAAAAGIPPGARPVVDGSAFDDAPYPPGWSWDDFSYDYAAPLTALPVDENAVTLSVAPGPRVGAPLAVATAAGFGAPPAIAVAGTTGPANSPAAVDAVRSAPDAPTTIVGSLPLGGAAQTVAVARRDPPADVAAILSATLAERPAAAARRRPPAAGRVWTHDGEPLADLLADMWWPSDNFVAEMLLRAIGLQAGGRPGTTERGAAAERAWLTRIGVDPRTLTIVDGSGLSSYDRVTPRALVAILQADWNGPDRTLVLDDLPLAGVRGTLADGWNGSLAERRTFAKTGSVNHARGLAGYLATVRHGAVTFAWSVDDWMGSDADLRALRARVLSRVIGD